MSALKLHTLKQKLWAIVAASFIARVVMFFVLPNTPSSLAPDEGTYATLTKWISESKPAINFPLFGEGLYLSGRSVILPASFLTRAGVNELDAVRLIATFYGFVALVLIVFLISKLVSVENVDERNRRYNENLIVGLVFVFAFLPSHFVWSNLALREGATEFGLIATFISFFFIVYHRKKSSVLTLIALFGSIVVTFSARPQVGWVLGVSLILYLVFTLRTRNTLAVLPIVICGVLLGSNLNLGTTGTTETSIARIFNPLLNAGEIVAVKQELNQVDAASVIKQPACPRDNPNAALYPSSKIDTYFCIAWRAPYMVSTFLFRPILGVDVTSISSLIAAIENIFWFALFMTIMFLMIRKRTISFLNPILPGLIFFVLYVLGASAYQGNMGTGFRHKSLILWSVLLLIFALAWRKTEETSGKPRNNSQESAV